MNYLGHWEAEELGGKGTGLTFTFKYCRLIINNIIIIITKGTGLTFTFQYCWLTHDSCIY